MPICLRILSIVLVPVICIPLASISVTDSFLRLQGLVLDKAGRGIGYARVVVISRSGELTKTKHDNPPTGQGFKNRLVTYTDKKGNWQINIPQCQTFLIKTCSNAYEVGQKSVVFEEWNKNREKIVQFLNEGFSHILWGSLDHIQLYVHPVHQKNIENLVRSGDLKALDAYMDTEVESDQKKYASSWAGYILFENSQLDASKIYFDKAGSKLWFNLMGKYHLRENRNQEALSYYLNGMTTRDRADDSFLLAKRFEHIKNLKNARHCYELAVSDYKSLLYDFKYKWDSTYIDNINFCLEKLPGEFEVENKTETSKKELKLILNKAGKYCQKLDKTKIYYFCNEVKNDKVFLIKKLARALENPAKFFRNYSPVKLRGTRIVDFYKYDLQYLKEVDGTVNENRKLLIENLDNSNPGIPVLSYSIMEPLHGPHTLVGFGWQNMFQYEILAEEMIYDEEALIVEVTPRMYTNHNRMSGKIWLNKRIGSVLKIEWYHRGIQNREQLRIIGLILEREPELKFVSEFVIKKGGLRFPSKCQMVESYVNDMGGRFIRLTVEIDYKNYNFFMVSSEIDVKEN